MSGNACLINLYDANDDVEGILVNKVGRRIFFTVKLISLLVVKCLVQKNVVRVLDAKFYVVVWVKVAEVVENIKRGRYLDDVPAQIRNILCENRHVTRASVYLNKAWYSLVLLGHTTDFYDSGGVVGSVSARELRKTILDSLTLIANCKTRL